MRGLPGSGKSTYILENYPESTPVSADFFFDELAERQGKTYTEVFDPSLLYEAHQQCWRDFMMAIAANAEFVVDNTNTRLAEYKNYVLMAKLFGEDYECEIIEIECPDTRTLNKFHARGTHGVPKETMRAMRNRWEEDPRAIKV